MKKTCLLLSLLLCVSLSLVFPPFTYANEEKCKNISSLGLDDVQKCLSDLTDAYNKSVSATKPLESQLTAMQQQINDIKARVNSIDVQAQQKKKEIDEGYKALARQMDILHQALQDYYIKSYYNSPLLALASVESASEITRTLAYQKAATDQDKAIITNIVLSIHDLEEKKIALEKEQAQLLVVKKDLDVQSAKLDETVKGAKAYQSNLSGQIAALSAKQQEILNAKSGSFTFSIGSGELADEYNASIKGFREAAPGGYFAVFSFGAYTHRKGMSQYGARGRAQAGQDYKAILRAYYGKEPNNVDTGGSIKVLGFGEMDFETTYLWGIAEMPSSWHQEALKAQAVAARTYAYRYKKDGKEICTTEACQVFNKGKSDSSPQAWKDAVEATKGQVLEDVVTYYASTHGGYASPIGWDTNDGSGGSNFIDKAWEKEGGSPWLYKAWWREHYSNSGATCGRSNPWLSPEEMADIVNAAIALKTSGIDTGRITPVTTSCWGGNPYSMEELRNLVTEKGGISSATSVSVSQGDGTTNTVTINGVSLSGNEFKQAFNLRGPGYIRIPQTGFAFFNIERK